MLQRNIETGNTENNALRIEYRHVVEECPQTEPFYENCYHVCTLRYFLNNNSHRLPSES